MKNLITILLLFFTGCFFAQNITISEPISMGTDDDFDFIGKIKGQYLIFEDKGSVFKIQAFGKRLQLKWDKEIELEKRRTKILGVISSKEDFSVIYTCKKKRNLNILLSRFSPAANLLDTAIIKVYEKSFLTPNFKIIRSEDKKKILIYHIKDQRKLTALVFDLETMKVLWEKTMQPESMTYSETYEQILLNNKGEIFVILQKNNKKHKRKKHHYEIHHINNSGKSSFFTIHMEEKMTYDIYFSYDNKNNELIAGGLYSKKNRGRANGYFSLKIAPDDTENYQLVFTEFDKEVIDNLIGKKTTVEKGIADIDIQDIVHRHDGGILLMIERNRHVERGGGSNRGGYVYHSIVDYYYDDIIIISIQPDGATHWKTILHKKQYSQNDDALYSSYFLLKTPSNLRFIFNDEIKFENTVSEYVVKGNGDFERNSIMSTEDQKIQLRFMDALQVGARELIIPSITRSKMKLTRVEF